MVHQHDTLRGIGFEAYAHVDCDAAEEAGEWDYSKAAANQAREWNAASTYVRVGKSYLDCFAQS